MWQILPPAPAGCPHNNNNNNITFHSRRVAPRCCPPARPRAAPPHGPMPRPCAAPRCCAPAQPHASPLRSLGRACLANSPAGTCWVPSQQQRQHTIPYPPRPYTAPHHCAAPHSCSAQPLAGAPLRSPTLLRPDTAPRCAPARPHAAPLRSPTLRPYTAPPPLRRPTQLLCAAPRRCTPAQPHAAAPRRSPTLLHP